MDQPKFEFSHVGVNADSREEANKKVNLLAAMFGLEARTNRKGSPFVGHEIEIMAGNPVGTHGHLAFYTDDMEKALQYFEEKEIKINMDSAKRREDGSIYVIYLQDEIAGFAIQLINKKD